MTISFELLRNLNLLILDSRKYQNSDDDSWEAEMKNKKQIKSIQQTTFTNSNMKDQFQANSNSQNQPQIVLKMTRVSILSILYYLIPFA